MYQLKLRWYRYNIGHGGNKEWVQGRPLHRRQENKHVTSELTKVNSTSAFPVTSRRVPETK
ncbi:hypothetical protein J6590_008221 [Homalodisca vitripennis]|nr:hypothetical protein J6590_008221 [Homalodisca vitripennis]